MNKIGIVCGIGPATTVMYYKEILEKYKSINGIEFSPQLVLESINMFEFDDALYKNDYNKVVKVLSNAIDNLSNAGATICAIACNTAHIVIEELKAQSKIPIISILDVTCQHIINKKYKNILVLASGTTMKNGMYKDVLERIKVNPIIPKEEDIKKVADIIYPNLENGIILKEEKVCMLEIVNRYIKEHNIDAVLLGCTELPLIIEENDINVDIINTAQLHISEIVKNI